ncbi:hypothetical protein CLV30_102295 [Haloactinopolyspora alba]|uniref:Glycoside hydrolase family 127 protein n=1 Tax=Haloactinopolyspora alba TaxID=648780 RepID=A0A2P8EBS0_9ACTN|nr:beta-L-arabinofuranosidase domain-containing protein [Haloactinopolyspora alba]PSL06906.1 hypothetical protein CLV30_102295 [Haloactinopolyspora alba]
MTAQRTSTGTDPTGGRPVVPSLGRRRPLGVNEIELTGGFWATLQATNAAATFEHCEHWMERLGWLANFDRVAAGTTGPDRPGWSFSDSEVYKLIEALCWEFARSGDPVVDDAVRRLTARIAPAQDPDGYLNTCYGHPQQQPRYSDPEMGHELYCTGHLLQAAVARLRTTGTDELVQVARRAADHVCETFGENGLRAVCGHPEIEVGLAELGRVLGEERYLEQAQLFLDRRGHGTLRDIPLGRAYFQDDVPIRKADTWRGHAVRALYLAAAAVDVAVERDDGALLDAVQRQWAHAVARQTYLTGGMGSRHQDEGFGSDWELPSDRAYCETCAGVASVMVSWRLYLATGEVRYADLIERTFLNVVATSPRSDGRAFFYANPLHQRVADDWPGEDGVSLRAESGARAAWFDVSCCPTNVARTLASWQAYAASAGERDLTFLQFTGMRVDAELGDGRSVSVDVDTDYPDDGLVRFRIVRAPSGPVALRLRVPEWAEDALLDEGGRLRRVQPGFAVVDRELEDGEELRLQLPTAPRFTWPDRHVDAVRGCVAVERGPLVYCAEAIDLPEGVDLEDVVLDTDTEPVARDGRVIVRAVVQPGPEDSRWPYHRRAPLLGPSRSNEQAHADGMGPDGTGPDETRTDGFDVTLTPYHQWAEREPTAMRVWLPVLTR